MQPRNRLDVFLPRKEWRAAGPRPTVIFITGGAWTIGYKGELPLGVWKHDFGFWRYSVVPLGLQGSVGVELMGRPTAKGGWPQHTLIHALVTAAPLAPPTAWGALLGRRLSQRGVLVFCLDYRNFPQASCSCCCLVAACAAACLPMSEFLLPNPRAYGRHPCRAMRWT